MFPSFILCVYVVFLARCEATSPTISTGRTQQFHQTRHISHVKVVGGMLLQVLESSDLVSTALYVYGSYVRFADGVRVSLPVEDPLSASRCESETGSVKCEKDRSGCRLDSSRWTWSGGQKMYWCYYDAVFTRLQSCSFDESSRECRCASFVYRADERQACRSCSDLSQDCQTESAPIFAGQSIPMTTQWTERAVNQVNPNYPVDTTQLVLWIAPSISFAATVVWMARWHFRSMSLRAQILIALGFGGVLPVALGFLVFFTGSNALVGVLLIFWVSEAWLVLLWRGCMHAGASEERRSAMLQVPLFGVWVMSKLTPEKFKTHQEKFWAYKGGLRFVEDIPQAIVASIDLCLYGGSYFAVPDLALSVISILAFLSTEPSWKLIKHMSALSVAHVVACVVACHGCVVSCIKSLDACVEDVAGRDEEAAEEEAAEEGPEGETAVEGKVLEEDVMTSFTNPLYSNPWEVDSVE